AEDGIRDRNVTGVQTCALPISNPLDIPSGGLCQAPAPGCNFQVLLTTLSAHSFDFVVPMPGNGTHKVAVLWSEIGTTKSTTGGKIGRASCRERVEHEEGCVASR